jgi:hypothetical protein
MTVVKMTSPAPAVKRLAGQIMHIAAGEAGPCHGVRVMCDYCRGETVGPV